MRLLLGLAVLVVVVMIAWWSVSGQEPGGTRLSSIDLPEPHQTNATGSMAAEKYQVKVTGLINRIDKLTDSVTQLESKLMSAHLIMDSLVDAEKRLASSITTERQAMAEAEQITGILPPPAAGHTGKEMSVAKTSPQASDGIATRHQDTTVIDPATSIEPAERQAMVEAGLIVETSTSSGADTVEGGPSSNRKTLDIATSEAAVMEHQDPVTKKQPAVSVDKNGPWVINLASTSSKTDADRLAKKARSRDIQTEQQQVTVKGTQYWRVQITGFSTAEDARTYADTAREKLGLKDVWIMKY